MLEITLSQAFRASNEIAAIAEQIKSNFAGAIIDLLGLMLKRAKSLQKAEVYSHELTDQFRKTVTLALNYCLLDNTVRAFHESYL